MTMNGIIARAINPTRREGPFMWDDAWGLALVMIDWILQLEMK